MPAAPDLAAARGAWRREASTIVIGGGAAPTSVPAPFAILAESADVEPPLEFEPHAHPLHELVWVRGGTMTVRLDDRLVTVPDGHGLWLPAGTTHSGRTTARIALCSALFDPERSPASFVEQGAFAEPMVVEVPPVLAALLAYLERHDLAEPARQRAEAVVFDVLAPAALQLSLQVPEAGRVGPLVAALLDDPTDDRTLGEWAEQLACSERTLARSFRTRTGLSFMQWRQALRVHHALSLMTEGIAVQDVAERMGYAQSSTFIASFKRVMGATPGAFLADRRRSAP